MEHMRLTVMPSPIAKQPTSDLDPGAGLSLYSHSPPAFGVPPTPLNPNLLGISTTIYSSKSSSSLPHNMGVQKFLDRKEAEFCMAKQRRLYAYLQSGGSVPRQIPLTLQTAFLSSPGLLECLRDRYLLQRLTNESC